MAFTDKLFLEKCPLLSVSFALPDKNFQIFAVKYLLLIYYQLGDRFRAILALLFSSPVHEVLRVSYCDGLLSGVRRPSTFSPQ